MRSKIARRIYSETPEKVKEEVRAFPALYIDQSGVIRYIAECPEEPTIIEIVGLPRGPSRFKQRFAYEQALDAAKESAIELHNNYLNAKLLFDCLADIGVPAEKAGEWLIKHKGQVIPLPEGWSVDVRESVDWQKHGHKAFQVAVLIPPMIHKGR